MNPERRIDTFCDELKRLWRRVPDWRFGQLMCNLLGEVHDEARKDPFYIEDGELLEVFDRVLNKWFSD